MSKKDSILAIKKKKIFKRKSLITNKKYLKNNIDNIIQDIENLGKNIETYPERIIQALQTFPEERTIEDLACLKHFLEHSQLANKFKSDNLTKKSLDKIFTLCSSQMKYLYLKSDNILFRIGDEPDNFYLIIDGRIGILKPIFRKFEMSGFEYFKHIMKLKYTNEQYLLNLTLNKNLNVFNINRFDLDDLNMILLKMLIEDFFHLGVKSTRTIEEICEICFVDKNFFDIQLEEGKMKNKEYLALMEKKCLDKLSSVHQEITQKYRNLTNETIKWPITLYEYKKFLELGTNDFFGDSALDKKTTRNATIKTVQDTHFCYLELNHYSYYLRDEKQKLTKKEVEFLVKNFFFKCILHHQFEKKYLNYFIYEEGYKNEIIIRENTQIDYVYFIKEGSCELYINKNVLEIHDMINYLLQLLKDSNIQKPEIKCKNEYFNLQSQFEESEKLKILYAEVKDTLGAESLYYGLNYLYNAKVSSGICKYYKIETKDLMKILDEEHDCIDLYQSECNKKMHVLLNRLISLNVSKIEKIDKQETINKNLLLGKNDKKMLELDLEKNRFKTNLERKKDFLLNKEKKKNNNCKNINSQKNLYSLFGKNLRTFSFERYYNYKNFRLDYKRFNIIKKNINERRTMDEILKDSIKASGKKQFNSIYGSKYIKVFSPGTFTIKNEAELVNKLQKEINRESMFFDSKKKLDSKLIKDKKIKKDNKKGKKIEKIEKIEIENKNLSDNEVNKNEIGNKIENKIEFNQNYYKKITLPNKIPRKYQPLSYDSKGIKRKLLINDEIFDTLKKYSIFEKDNSQTESNYYIDSGPNTTRNNIPMNSISNNFHTIGSIVNNSNKINNINSDSQNIKNNTSDYKNSKTVENFSRNYQSLSLPLSSSGSNRREERKIFRPKRKRIVSNFIFEKNVIYKRFKEKLKNVDFWYNKKNYMV